jgi:dipeptidyl aminopeptidase/acylaminoacyl peptidase
MRVIILLILIIPIGIYLWLSQNPKPTSLPITISEILTLKTPEPFLFQEITIPYLRGRPYESSLGPMEEYQDSANYTSYLTSYYSDGLKVNGLITIPKGDGPHPAIVFVHGYIAPTVYETTEKYVDYVNYLARNGFVVFKIDLRGHGDSEGEPGGSYYSSDYIIDTLNAYSALENADFVNPRKIGLWGHSMAGNVLLRSIAVKKDIPAAVIWSGAGYTYSDLATYRLMDRSYRPPTADTERQRKRQLLNDSYGTFDPNSWFWKLVPATNYLDGVTTALEIHHAIDDDVVSVEYSRNLMKILDSTKIPHELFEYQTGGHNITGSSFTQAMQKTVDFYKINLE